MNIEFTVSDLQKCLDGYENDIVVKIKLCDGTTKDIAGFSFRNACIGGDNIIYIEEVNPLKIKYGSEIEELTVFAEQIFEVCEKEEIKGNRKYRDEFDNSYILGVIIEICKEMDYYIRKCKLENIVRERIGFFESGCGSHEEALMKLDILRDFVL